MNRQERFSLRKYKFGVASVLLGALHKRVLKNKQPAKQVLEHSL